MDDNVENIMGIGYVDNDTNSDTELEGLGQRIRQPFSIQQKGVIKKFAESKKRQALLQTTASKGQRHMLAKVGELDKQAQADIAAGKIKFINLDYYWRRLFAGNSTDLIKAADQQKVGISNFNSNVMPVGRNMDITHVALAYAYNASATDPANNVYTNAGDAETGGSSPLSIPISFMNGEIIVKINGAEIINLPVKKFFRDGLSVNGSLKPSDNAVELSTPILFKEGQTLEAIVKCADGIALPANNHFVELRLIGEGLAPKG